MEREGAAPEALVIEEVREEGLAALLDFCVHSYWKSDRRIFRHSEPGTVASLRDSQRPGWRPGNVPALAPLRH